MGFLKKVVKAVAPVAKFVNPVALAANMPFVPLADKVTSGFFGGADKEGGVDFSGAPKRPGFQTLLKTDDTGKYTDFNLPEQLQQKEVLGAEGRTALKERALAKGRSPWADMMVQKQQMEEQGQLGDLSSQGNTALLGAQAGLARSGGLRSGVGANLAAQNMKDRMLQGQQVRQAGFGSRLGIDLQDDQTKTALLTNLQGRDAAASQGNIANALGEKRAKDVADMAAYTEQMKGWAAGKQGQAIQNSGKK